MARPLRTSADAAGPSSPIVLNSQYQDFNVTLQGEQNGATATWDIEATVDNVMRPGATLTWVKLDTGKSADFSRALTQPYQAVRLNVTAYTSGTVILKALQGS